MMKKLICLLLIVLLFSCTQETNVNSEETNVNSEETNVTVEETKVLTGQIWVREYNLETPFEEIESPDL
jgi:thioredoxin-related protein